MKRMLLTLSLLLLAKPADAIYVPSHLAAGGTLTKLGDQDYEFQFSFSFYDYSLPLGGIDPVSGYPIAYYLYPPGWFGLSTPDGVYERNEGFGAGTGGWFKTNQAPTDPMHLYASYDIVGELTLTGNIYSRFFAGSLSGEAALFGSIPTEIGQSTAWSATPEPATLALLALGLLTLFRKVPNPSRWLRGI